MTSSSSLSEQKFSVLASKYIKSVEILFRIDSVSLCCLSVSEHVSCCFPDVEVYSNLHHVFVLKCFFSEFRNDIFHQSPIFTEM